MTAAQKRKEARAARDAAKWLVDHAAMIGYRTLNGGNDLVMGAEWETPDGYRVRQVEVWPDSQEQGHFYGRIEVIDFAERMKA